MKKRKTIYHLIVDKSGSMYDCIDSTINGFNEQVNRIKSNEIEFIDEEIAIGLTTFNTNVYHHFFQSKPSDVIPLDYDNYIPDDSTALLDAIGQTIQLIENEVKITKEGLPTTIVIVILTDGYENASRIFTLECIRDIISRLEETGIWTFSFIGATIDAVEVAKDLAIKPYNSFNFDKSEMSSKVWAKLIDSMTAYFDKKNKGKKIDNLYED